jgi:hypothetical protein
LGDGDYLAITTRAIIAANTHPKIFRAKFASACVAWILLGRTDPVSPYESLR